MNWKIIFNPFEKFDEKLLLAIGLLGYALTCILSYYFKNPVLSIYKIGTDDQLTLLSAFKYTTTSFLVAIFVLVILSKIFNKNSRIIDIVNSVLISQIPVLLLFFFSNISTFKKIGENVAKNINAPEKIKLETADLLIISIVAFISLSILVFSIALLFNGFKTATNIKSWQKITVFAVVLFITIVVSQTIIPTLNF